MTTVAEPSALAMLKAIAQPPRRRRPWRGLTLFGAVLSLGIAAVATVGAISVYNTAQDREKRSEALALLAELRSSVETTFSSTGDYGNAASLTDTLDVRGHIPEKARFDNAGTIEIRHPYGDTVTVTGGPGGTTNTFLIGFDNVDDEICAALGDAYVDRNRARSGLISITINTTALTSPVTSAQITANCTGGAGANDIAWTFG